MRGLVRRILVVVVGYVISAPLLAQEKSEGTSSAPSNDLRKVLADCAEEIRREPKNPVHYLNRGALWMEMKEYDKAIADYSEGIRILPQWEVIYFNRGLAWSAKKVHDKAIADFTEATRLDPTFAAAYCQRGVSLHMKKEYERSARDFDRAERPTGKTALDESCRKTALKQAYAQLSLHLSSSRVASERDGKKAIEFAMKVLKFAEESERPFSIAQAQIILAAAQAEAGQFKEAIRLQEQAMQVADELRDDRDMRARLELYRNRKPYRQP